MKKQEFNNEFNYNKLNNDGIINLSNAIVTQAAEDYRTDFFKRSSVDFNDAVKFFKSGWFAHLTKANPEYIKDKLNEEIKEFGESIDKLLFTEEGNKCLNDEVYNWSHKLNKKTNRMVAKHHMYNYYGFTVTDKNDKSKYKVVFRTKDTINKNTTAYDLFLKKIKKGKIDQFSDYIYAGGDIELSKPTYVKVITKKNLELKSSTPKPRVQGFLIKNTINDDWLWRR